MAEWIYCEAHYNCLGSLETFSVICEPFVLFITHDIICISYWIDNGFLSVDDLWPRGNDDEEEPDWLKTEKEQFHSYRDQDKDGFMNRKEVKDWIIPPDYDHTRAEAKHLIYNADANKVIQILWLDWLKISYMSKTGCTMFV